MLQQTQVATVLPYFQRWMQRLPTLGALARAPLAARLHAWQGLGYYSRARRLHDGARVVLERHNGELPRERHALLALPGIGEYSAGAIASIAFGAREPLVDGNVVRVLARRFGLRGDPAKLPLRRALWELAGALVPEVRPGDFNQALMELGATVCLPRNPQCLTCPLVKDCVTRGEHKKPARAPMLSREVGHALAVRSGRKAGDEVLLEQRPASESVMPGLWQLPALCDAAVPEDDVRMTVRHAIMQVNYYVRIRAVSEEDVDALTVAGGKRRWVPIADAAGMALTGLTRKVLTRARLLPSIPMEAIALQLEADLI